MHLSPSTLLAATLKERTMTDLASQELWSPTAAPSLKVSADGSNPPPAAEATAGEGQGAHNLVHLGDPGGGAESGLLVANLEPSLGGGGGRGGVAVRDVEEVLPSRLSTENFRENAAI